MQRSGYKILSIVKKVRVKSNTTVREDEINLAVHPSNNKTVTPSQAPIGLDAARPGSNQ